MRLRIFQIPLLLLIAGLLAACGQQAQALPSPTLAAPTLPPAPPPADPAAPTPTLLAAPAPAPSPTAAPAPAASDLAAIPQSRSEEGYQILGAPDAPVTLVMYSDFF